MTLARAVAHEAGNESQHRRTGEEGLLWAMLDRAWRDLNTRPLYPVREENSLNSHDGARASAINWFLDDREESTSIPFKYPWLANMLNLGVQLRGVFYARALAQRTNHNAARRMVG